MINLKSFIGEPITFGRICEIYPPKVKDMITNDNYNIYQKLLTTSQEEIYDSLNKAPIDDTPQFTVSLEVDGGVMPKPLRNESKVSEVQTPLEYLLINCYHNKAFLKLTQDAFKFFTHCDILPMYDMKSIYVGNLEDITNYKRIEDLPLLNEENFLDFQNAIRSILNMEQIDAPDPNEDPRITRMKAKARYRDQVKAKGGQSLSFSSMLVAICCMGIGITPLNIGELSYGAISAIFATYQGKEKYELDTSSLLAGADPKKIKPKYWITNQNE